MKTLPKDTTRCAGYSPMTGYFCRERIECQRYLAFRDWDREAGVVDYVGISVMAGQRGCGVMIEVEGGSDDSD